MSVRQTGVAFWRKQIQPALVPTRLRPHPLVCLISDRAFRHGVPLPELVARAQVARSTWARLVKGGAPKLSTIDRLMAELDLIISEDEHA
ncbi:MAG TPA: hypothetical protein VIJ94_00965 [Caulobacteraceae bacterium]